MYTGALQIVYIETHVLWVLKGAVDSQEIYMLH